MIVSLNNIKEDLDNLIVIDYDKYLQELRSEQDVFLDEDPSSKGLMSLNQKIAHIDARKTRVGNILITAYENESNIERLHNTITYLYGKRRAELLGSKEIMKLSNQQLREAAVVLAMDDVLNIQNSIRSLMLNAKSFTKIVQQALVSLESTNKNISRQLTTIQTMVEIGELNKQWDGE